MVNYSVAIEAWVKTLKSCLCRKKVAKRIIMAPSNNLEKPLGGKEAKENPKLESLTPSYEMPESVNPSFCKRAVKW